MKNMPKQVEHNTMATLQTTNVDTTAGRLRDARQAAGLSLRELAMRAGTSHATLLAYENGSKTPAVTTYVRILEAAGFAVDITLSRRVRQKDGIDRGEELEAVLRLAEQFPARADRHLTSPLFPQPV